MTSPSSFSRVRVLPDHGQLLVSTDLHGNLGDFERLEEIFLELREAAQQPDDVHWAILGDLVHGPSIAANLRDPDRFGYPDDSPLLVERVIALRERFPNNLHFVLGNHDHGHIGGPHPSKFHRDEVMALERRMSPEAVANMRVLFESAMLALAAPCGLLFCHGSPDDQLTSLDQLAHIDPRDEADMHEAALLRSVLTSYGQPGEITAKMLAQISTDELALNVVVHGHDVDLDGWYTEGHNQACPVLFGALPMMRRYLLIDLRARYRSAADLRVGREVRYLHPKPSSKSAS